MGHFHFCPARESDAPVIVALNADSVAVTSPMDEQRLASLSAMSKWVTVAQLDNHVVGFLLAFTAGADYDSVNYRWFSERLRQFVYIDRIVIGAAHRGAGLGQLFYTELQSNARNSGLHWLAAEMNLLPPNEASLRFHQRAGFVEVGTLALTQAKLMSMQVRAVEPLS